MHTSASALERVDGAGLKPKWLSGSMDRRFKLACVAGSRLNRYCKTHTKLRCIIGSSPGPGKLTSVVIDEGLRHPDFKWQVCYLLQEAHFTYKPQSHIEAAASKNALQQTFGKPRQHSPVRWYLSVQAPVPRYGTPPGESRNSPC